MDCWGTRRKAAHAKRGLRFSRQRRAMPEILGRYKVKDSKPDMLQSAAKHLLHPLSRTAIEHGRRKQNSAADSPR